MTVNEFIEEFQRRRAACECIRDSVKIELSEVGRDSISLDLIESDIAVRQQRLASKALHILLGLSDEVGMPIELIPSRLEGKGDSMTDEQLAAWYQRIGFVPLPTADKPRRMVRMPLSP